MGEKSVYLVDANSERTYDTVRALPENNWKAATKDTLSLGYTEETVWIKLRLNNNSSHVNWMLDVAYPVLDHVMIYVESPSGGSTFSLGDRLEFDTRPVNHRNFVVPLEIPVRSEANIYIKINSTSSLQIPIKLWEQASFYDHEQNMLMWQGIYFGCLLVMIFYNLCLFYYSREKQYFYFALVFTSFASFQATISGISYQFLWPSSPLWNERALPIFLGLVLLTESLFMAAFLELKNSAPKVGKFLVLTSILSGSIILLSPFVSYRFAIICLIILALPINIVGFVIGIKQSLEGRRPAKFFTFAWCGTLFGAVLLALSKLGGLERNFFTENALQIGSIFSVIWLSFALGEYFAQRTREREKAKQDALDYALKIAQERRDKLSAQDAALQAQKRSNDELEALVKIRTEELNNAMLELEHAHETLKHSSNLDDLTGIYNRRYFNTRFEADFKRAQRLQTPLSVLLIDIDHFKKVNDTYGHLLGDICLKSVAVALQASLSQPGDSVSRYGGEEFVVLLPDTDSHSAKTVAKRLAEIVGQQEVSYHETRLNVTLSVGICSIIPNENDEREQLLNNADKALYRAKEEGRNCVRTYQK